MGRGKYNRREYILNFAQTALSQLDIDPLEGTVWGSSAAEIGKALATKHHLKVQQYLTLRHSPATLGKLADCGIGSVMDVVAESNLFNSFSGTGTTLEHVMGQDWLKQSGREWGSTILLEVATAALLAAMADVIFIRQRKEMAMTPDCVTRFNADMDRV